MTVKHSSLRVISEFDASGYARGMAAKVAADASSIQRIERRQAQFEQEFAKNVYSAQRRQEVRGVRG